MLSVDINLFHLCAEQETLYTNFNVDFFFYHKNIFKSSLNQKVIKGYGWIYLVQVGLVREIYEGNFEKKNHLKLLSKVSICLFMNLQLFI